MSELDIKDLVRRTPISFVGTVQHLGAATSRDLPIDDHTAVVGVDLVLHAPDELQGLEGQRVTVQLSGDVDLPAEGDQIVVFAQGLAFGETIALAEVGRAPVEAIAGHASSAAGDSRQPMPFAQVERELETEALREHVDQAEAVVVATVTGLEQAQPKGFSEHDPDWWRATLEVRQVVRGDLEPGSLDVLYPNSLDIAWYRVPKPKASQDGIWILHAPAEGTPGELAAYQLMHEEDRQPLEALSRLVGED
jgi:hypothetical protein